MSVSVSILASEQMLYQVYENAIGMIEELEKHEEHGKSAGNSGLLKHVIPKDRKKDQRDVSGCCGGGFDDPVRGVYLSLIPEIQGAVTLIPKITKGTIIFIICKTISLCPLSL